MLLSLATRSRRPGVIPAGLALLGTAPLLIVVAFTAKAGVWTGSIVNAVLAVGVLADTRWRPARKPEWPVSTLALVLAIIAVAFAALALAAPHLVHVSSYRVLLSRPTLFIAGMLIVPVALGIGWIAPRFRALTQVAAALPFWGLAAGFAAVRGWSGAVLYGLLGGFLAAEPVLSRLIERRAAERQEQSDWASAYEFATEAVAWGLVLLIGLVTSIDTVPERRLGQAVIALCTSVFTTIWYHFVPVRHTGSRHTIIATAVYSFLGVLLVQLTGGAQSPYFYAYFLPIIALAWTQIPHMIVIPLSIPLAALITEIVGGVRTDPLGAGEALFVAVPRVAGLLFIAGFTYILARRNLENGNRVLEARRQFEAVLTHMAEGLVTIDEAGRVTLCNPAAVELIGFSSHEMRGRLLVEVLPVRQTDGAKLPPEAHPAQRALTGQRVASERLIVERPDGVRTLAVSATPLAGVNGGRGAIVMLRDSKAEVEMERMRDDFLFIASHELRTPLTVMKGNLEMALEASPSPVLRRALEDALGSTARLIRMVNDFLDAARLEHGAVSLRLEDEQLPALVQQAVETLQPDAARKGLTITYRAPRGLPAVRMDVERTMQILLNLIGNGIRYTQHGGLDINHALDGGVLETIIRDTGIGIAPEHHSRLFSRFGQVERGLTRASGGSGLGLYISRKLAEQMGGTVVLKASAPGQGSAFALRLPVASVAAAVR
ncbi:MAG: sensor histidine kinase [Armatimonadota bacterium]